MPPARIVGQKESHVEPAVGKFSMTLARGLCPTRHTLRTSAGKKRQANTAWCVTISGRCGAKAAVLALPGSAEETAQKVTSGSAG